MTRSKKAVGAGAHPRTAPPTRARCAICDQTVPLVDVHRSGLEEFTGRFVEHERVVTAGKPPRRCPAVVYIAHPEQYDTEDD